MSPQLTFPSTKELREMLAARNRTLAEPIGLGDMMVEGGEIVEPEGYYPPALPAPPDYGTERFRERARQLAERQAPAMPNFFGPPRERMDGSDEVTRYGGGEIRTQPIDRWPTYPETAWRGQSKAPFAPDFTDLEGSMYEVYSAPEFLGEPPTYAPTSGGRLSPDEQRGSQMRVMLEDMAKGTPYEMVEAPQTSGVASAPAPEMVERLPYAPIPFSVADQLPKAATAPFSPLAPKNESLGDPAIGTPVKDAAFDTVSISEYSPEVVSEAVNVAQGDSVATSPEVQALADRLKRRAAGRIPSITQVEGEAPMVSFQPEAAPPSDDDQELYELGFDRDEQEQIKKEEGLARRRARMGLEMDDKAFERSQKRVEETQASGKLKLGAMRLGPNGVEATFVPPGELPSERDRDEFLAKRAEKAAEIKEKLAGQSAKTNLDFFDSSKNQFVKATSELGELTPEQMDANVFLDAVIAGKFSNHKNTAVLQQMIGKNLRQFADVDEYTLSLLLSALEDSGVIPRYEGE